VLARKQDIRNALYADFRKHPSEVVTSRCGCDLTASRRRSAF
jgi:hypothetical protein